MLEKYALSKSEKIKPTLEEVLARLPATISLSIWDGRPSCSNGDDADPIRTQANTFLEAAILMMSALEMGK